MSKRRKEHRREKLFEKVQSQNGLRMQNRWWREQVKWSKLPLLVIKDVPEWTDRMAEAWLNWAKTPGTILYKSVQTHSI